MPSSIAIIGGGFVGSLLTLNLLKSLSQVVHTSFTIYLIEKKIAGDWAQDPAQIISNSKIRFRKIVDEVTDLTPRGNKIKITTLKSHIEVDRVYLAIGMGEEALHHLPQIYSESPLVPVEIAIPPLKNFQNLVQVLQKIKKISPHFFLSPDSLFQMIQEMQSLWPKLCLKEKRIFFRFIYPGIWQRLVALDNDLSLPVKLNLCNQSRLIKNLIQKGLLCPHPTGFGANTNSLGVIINKNQRYFPNIILMGKWRMGEDITSLQDYQLLQQVNLEVDLITKQIQAEEIHQYLQLR